MVVLGSVTLPSGKLTLQWKMDPLKMYFLLNMGIFHGYVGFPEGTRFSVLNNFFPVR